MDRMWRDNRPRFQLRFRDSAIGKLSVALGLAVLVAACRPAAPPETNQSPAPAVRDNVPGQEAKPEPAPVEETPVQRVSSTSPVPLPAGFPGDVPVYPDSVVTACSRAPQNRSVQVQCKAPGSLEKVLAFYRDVGQRAGWSMGEPSGSGAEKRLELTQGGRRLEAILTPEAGSTSCRLILAQ